MGILANSEDPDEMQFHQGLQVHNGQSNTYCINLYGKIYRTTNLVKKS